MTAADQPDLAAVLTDAVAAICELQREDDREHRQHGYHHEPNIQWHAADCALIEFRFAHNRVLKSHMLKQA